MLTPPDGLPGDALVSAIGAGWNLTIVSIDYRAVGFGSHHWDAVDAEGDRWFVTVDDLRSKQRSLDEGEDTAFARLQAALVTAQDLRAAGCDFVVGPISTAARAPALRIDRRYAVALYPYLVGESYAGGEFSTSSHRRGVLDLVIRLHMVPKAVTPCVQTDDFIIQHRDELERSIHRDENLACRGPYAGRASALLADHAANIQRLLLRYDALVQETRSEQKLMVITHGEPHAANTMLARDGWKLIDWDTILVAPPERDLWSLDPGDGSILNTYADATRTKPRPSMLALYRLRWDLADIAVYVSRFRGPHSDSTDDAKSWDELLDLITGLPT